MLGGSSEVVSICAVICCSCDGAAGAFCIGLSSELLNTLRRGLGFGGFLLLFFFFF